MALPTKIVDINTATWSDHKNQSHGGGQTILLALNVDNSTTFSLGNTIQYVTGAFQPPTGGAGRRLLRVHFFLERVGNPSGNITCTVRPEDGFLRTPDNNIVQAVSLPITCSSIPTSKTDITFHFLLPPNLPQVHPDGFTDQFFPILSLSAQGDGSNYIKVSRRDTDIGAPGVTRDYGSSTWVKDNSHSVCTTFEVSKAELIVFAVSPASNLSRGYRSTDNGSTWSLLSGSQSTLTTSGMKSIHAQAGVLDLGNSYSLQMNPTADVEVFNLPTNTTEVSSAIAATAFAALNANVSATGPIYGGRRISGSAVAVVQGATETVMGNARRRIKLKFYNGSTWSSEFDVVGSTNTPNATLPGTALDYDLRWAGVDPNGDCHTVYSKSDVSTLQYRKFKADNTFTTINTLNGAVASATANFPVGLGTFYYKNPDWYVAVPYVDNTSNTLKVARAKGSISETSANWTLTEAVAASAEVSTSNPAVLIADNGEGGKLFLWRVIPTTKGLRFTDDGGNDIWKPEADWRGATQVVGGISGFFTGDGIALVYLEEGTTPDELRYDHL